MSDNKPPVYHCRPCNSQRPGLQCWKCGADTTVPCDGWEYPLTPDINPIRQIARSLGYSVAVHGSQERDLDLIAVPWTPDAVGYMVFIEKLCEHINAVICGPIEEKPHGRIAVNINIDGWFKLIDLSIVPALP